MASNFADTKQWFNREKVIYDKLCKIMEKVIEIDSWKFNFKK